MMCRHILGESLFNPAAYAQPLSDVTERPLGIAEGAFDCSMVSTEPGSRQALLNSAVLCGGCAKIPNLHQRFMTDLRGLLPNSLNISMLKCAPAACRQCNIASGWHVASDSSFCRCTASMSTTLYVLPQ
jgi:actin-related protein